VLADDVGEGAVKTISEFPVATDYPREIERIGKEMRLEEVKITAFDIAERAGVGNLAKLLLRRLRVRG
jgi:hypothetical protein